MRTLFEINFEVFNVLSATRYVTRDLQTYKKSILFISFTHILIYTLLIGEILLLTLLIIAIYYSSTTS